MLFKNQALWTGLGDLGHIDALLALVAAGTLDPTPMINRHAKLEDIVEAIGQFADAGSGVVKYAVSVS